MGTIFRRPASTVSMASQSLSYRQTGARWEKTAESFLRSHGLKLLQRNFSSRFGEIDLIMRQGDALVFVEVRFRKHVQYGTGAESVDYRKQQKLLKCAEYFLQRNTKYNQYPCRIDVVSIGLKKPNATEDSTPTIDWIPNAIES